MSIVRIAAVIPAVLVAGWMAFDGTRALVLGSLVTPRSGPYAGQLGPWRHLVSAVGIDPGGKPMRIVFAAYGWSWLALCAVFLSGIAGAWKPMVAAAVGALWFLPIGTVLSLVEIAILLGLRSRFP